MESNTAGITLMSGGQSGVDRAVLDAALRHALPHGGWCPSGRRAEDGPIPACYRLRETPSEEYAQRTEWNVRDSDGTLLLFHGASPTGGTAFTRDCAIRLGKPFLQADPSETAQIVRVLEWIRTRGIGRLNVAGPRESASPGIHAETLAFLDRMLASLRDGPSDE